MANNEASNKLCKRFSREDEVSIAAPIMMVGIIGLFFSFISQKIVDTDGGDGFKQALIDSSFALSSVILVSGLACSRNVFSHLAGGDSQTVFFHQSTSSIHPELIDEGSDIDVNVTVSIRN